MVKKYIPSTKCKDHGDPNEENSIAWIINYVNGKKAEIILEPNVDYTIKRNLVIPENISISNLCKKGERPGTINTTESTTIFMYGYSEPH